jgi:hypothetical protein
MVSAFTTTTAAECSRLDCNGSRCHPECELRHLDEYEVKVRNKAAAPTDSSSGTQGVVETNAGTKHKLIVCAGPERAGSTWLYNALRHLHSSVDVECDSYWIHHLEAGKLEERLAEGRTIVVKTHKFYNDYDNPPRLARCVGVVPSLGLGV